MKKKKNTPAKKKSSQISKTAHHSSIGITPLADRLLVRPISMDEGMRRPSGIIIPDTVDKERPSEGIVVAVGPGAYDDGERIPMSVKTGDRIVFSKYGYDEVKVGDEEYYIVKEENVLAIIH